MTPEMEFAQALGELPTKDKLASALEKLSIEQLEEILRSEGVCHQPKVLETLEEKTAAADAYGRQLAQEGIADLEKEAARAPRFAPTDYAFGAGGVMGGLAGYHLGKKSKEKKSSVDLLRDVTAEIVKEAGIGSTIQKGVGMTARNLLKAPPAARLLTHGAVGAGVGALGGAVGAQPGNRMQGALAGGAVGGIAGAAAQPLVKHVAKGGFGDGAKKYLQKSMAPTKIKLTPKPAAATVKSTLKPKAKGK